MQLSRSAASQLLALCLLMVIGSVPSAPLAAVAPEGLAKMPGGKWKIVKFGAPRPPKRTGHAMTVLDGTVYLYGGSSETDLGERGGRRGGPVFGDLWEFNENTAEFFEVTAPEEPRARTQHGFAACDGKLFVFPGLGELGFPEIGIHSYDLQAGEWSRLAPTGQGPASLWGYTTTTIGNMVYLLGGFTGNVSNTAHNPAIWIYDCVKNEFTRGRAIPAGGLQGHSSVAFLGRIYAYGGQNPSGNEVLNQLWCYDPATNEWTLVQPDPRRARRAMKPPRREFASAVVYGNRMALLSGLNEKGKASKTTFEYNFDTNTWSKVAKPRRPFAGGASVVVDDDSSVLVFGGYRGKRGKGTNTLQRFVPAQ